MAVHVDAGDGALSHADGGGAVAADEAAEELEDVGIVADGQDALAVGIFGEHLLEVGVIGAEGEGGADFDFGFVAQLGADKLRGLEGALEGAGDDDVNLHLEGAEDAGHQHALVFSFLDEGPLGVESRVPAGHSGIGVAHQVEVHRVGSGEVKWGLPAPRGSILTHL